MKIKTLYLKAVIQTKNYANTLSSPKHSIEFIPEMNGYLIDNNTLIPSSNVAEVIVEVERLVELPDFPNPKAVEHSLSLQEAERTVHESSGKTRILKPKESKK